MAMFREHVAFGAIISMLVVVAVYFYALVTDPLLLMFLFGVTIIGSFLPDVDSDSGMPFYLIFGTATLAATGVVLLYTLNSEYASDWRYLTGIPAMALIIFWFIVGGIVKRCTHHRGIFHSVPALAISGVGSFLIARHYGLDETSAWIFGGAMAAGYLCHLVLDELHAGVTLDGVLFNPKSSFGSALKLFSDSSKVNLATYLLLAALLYTALAAPVAEAFYNDSDVIEIESDAPQTPPDDPGTGDGGGTGGSGGTGEGGGGDSGGSGGSGGTSGGGATGGGSGGSGGGGGGGSGSGPSEDDLIETLIDDGAIEGLIGGAGNSDAASGFSSGSVVTIVGAKVREALSGRSDLRDVLSSWKSLRAARGDSTGQRGAREYGLVAASTALSDTNIDTVSFSASTFEIVYRSRGYLIGIFPWSFPVRIEVVPQAPEGNRVTINLPWYRFFVREFFTVAKLSADIETALQTAAANAAADEDQSALLFGAVAQLLRQKVGTISDSVLLGTPVAE